MSAWQCCGQYNDHSPNCITFKVQELQAQLDEALVVINDILSNASLDWYVQHFAKSEAPTMESSGIVSKIHNLETHDRIRAVYGRAREFLAKHQKEGK